MNLLKLVISLSVAMGLAACVPFSVYQVAQFGQGTFSARPDRFLVDPENYPKFKLVGESREGPVMGGYNSLGHSSPALEEDDAWFVRYRIGNRFLMDSVDFSERHKQMRCDTYIGRTSQRTIDRCRQRDEGDFLLMMYVKSSGEAYGWQHIKNYERSVDKTSFFHIDDTGDWSGQPWFECVARCDKLERMQREEQEYPDPYGGPGQGRISF
ncbi:hypothetical protein [Franzmannia qiaohouensis]|uniref:Lipoprotein n=1 Tax=Franzmannia qiaohouensis TaxID=1329370 RepID=A0ABU1HHK7_9GAMM|nr:hypothetical protein [Halomonas qiaohouensis]MDR5906961.1 hypothetical protein [Halomonas qiaohouensis]